MRAYRYANTKKQIRGVRVMFYHDNIEIQNTGKIFLQDYTGKIAMEIETLPGAWHLRTSSNQYGVKELEFCHKKVFAGEIKVYQDEVYKADAHAKIRGTILSIGTSAYSAAEIADFSRELIASKIYGRYVRQGYMGPIAIHLSELDETWQIHIYKDENGRIAGLRITLCGIPEPNRSHKWAGSYC